MTVVVRRVEAHEWRLVRDLRLEALRDADAALAFLDTLDDALARDDEFWQQRTRAAASGDAAAQFVAIVDDVWVGAATGLAREPGSRDHLDRQVDAARVDIVGVYIAPDARSAGVIDLLLDAVAQWARDLGAPAIALDVHRDNLRAQAAYRRCGFTESGVRFTGPIGPELEMVRRLSP